MIEEWTTLHRKFVSGEPLSESERVNYEAGCHLLDAEEFLDGDTMRENRLYAEIAEMEEEHKALLSQQEVLIDQLARHGFIV